MRRVLVLGLILAAAAVGFLGALLSPVDRRDPVTVSYAVLPGENLTDVAGNLKSLGLIREPRSFVLMVRVLGKGRELQAGPYRARTDEWAWEILNRMVAGDFQDTTLTVPEGLWAAEVAELVGPVVAGGDTAFLAAAGDSALMSEFGLPAPHAEGYLFPSTYRVVPGTSARAMVRHMVRTFFFVWDGELAQRAEEIGWPMHEVVTLASIVEAEAQVGDERSRIAAVYRNRLEQDMPLQADPTVIYGLGERRSRTLYRDLKHPSPYNTYRNPGLPPGPIGNPGEEALRAVLWPLEGCRDLFFVARGDGTHLFAPDFSGHLANRRQVAEARRNAQ